MEMLEKMNTKGRTKPPSEWLKQRQLKEITDERGRNGFMLQIL